jgi:hypothetical protein
MYDEVGDDDDACIVHVKAGECEHYKDCAGAPDD